MSNPIPSPSRTPDLGALAPAPDAALGTLVYSRSLTDGSHTRRLEVERAPTEGWRVREEVDAQVVRNVTHADWHRVELAIRGFSAEAVRLAPQGWRVQN